jgi:hypothetical protein
LHDPAIQGINSHIMDLIVPPSFRLLRPWRDTCFWISSSKSVGRWTSGSDLDGMHLQRTIQDAAQSWWLYRLCG